MKSLRDTKHFVQDVCTEGQIEATKYQYEDTGIAQRKGFRIGVNALLVVCMVAGMSVSAFAAGGDVFDNVESFASDLTTNIRTLAVTLAVLALAICGLMYMFGGQRATENAKSWAIRICVAFAVIMGGSIIVDTVKTLTGF